MTPHPRIRKTIKWGGAALTVLLVVVWIGSGWWFVAWKSPQGSMVGVGGGAIAIGKQPSYVFLGAWSGLQIDHPHGPFMWWFGFEQQRGVAWLLCVPLWTLVTLSLLVTANAWRLDALARRARVGLCPKCNYDRAGLAKDAKCPECGAAPVNG